MSSAEAQEKSPAAAAAEEQVAEPVAEEMQATEAEDELTQLRREVEELREKNLRVLADAQNSAKRAQREKQESLRFAEADFARELLVILDDLERTQESARTATDVQAVGDGVRIVYEHFLKVLRQQGVEPIEAAGKAFDPDLHQAMMQQPSDEHPAGTVIQELARGYKMHERVLRATRVVVSSGPAESSEGGGKE